MATAEGIAKLVQKQAGRAKEKVSESKNSSFCHRSICHLIWHSVAVPSRLQWSGRTDPGLTWDSVGGRHRSLAAHARSERGVARCSYVRLSHTWPHCPVASPFLLFYVPPVQHSTHSTYMMPPVNNPSRVTMDSITCVTKMPPSSVPDRSGAYCIAIRGRVNRAQKCRSLRGRRVRGRRDLSVCLVSE